MNAKVNYTATEAAKLLQDDLPPGYGFVFFVAPIANEAVAADGAGFVVSNVPEDTILEMLLGYLESRGPMTSREI